MNDLIIILLIAIIVLSAIGYAYWSLVLKDKNSTKLIKGSRERLEKKNFQFRRTVEF